MTGIDLGQCRIRPVPHLASAVASDRRPARSRRPGFIRARVTARAAGPYPVPIQSSGPGRAGPGRTWPGRAFFAGPNRPGSRRGRSGPRRPGPASGSSRADPATGSPPSSTTRMNPNRPPGPARAGGRVSRGALGCVEKVGPEADTRDAFKQIRETPSSRYERRLQADTRGAFARKDVGLGLC